MKRLTNTDKPKARARFVREIDALKRIQHPGIVRPVDHSKQTDPQLFYVMPYEGGLVKLSELIWPRSGESPYKGEPALCLDFVAACADAITAAHAAKVTFASSHFPWRAFSISPQISQTKTGVMTV